MTKPQCTTRAEVFEQFARVSRLIEGTGLGIEHVHKYCGAFSTADRISHYPESKNYSFALAIVEGKPVFPGDTLWFYPVQGKPYNFTVETNWCEDSILNGYYSWQEPKRTFTLNGEELTMPVSTDEGAGSFYHILDMAKFSWDSAEERDKVQDALEKLLSGVSNEN